MHRTRIALAGWRQQMRWRPIGIIKTAALTVAAVVIATCQSATASADDIYTVEGKPIPSIASSDPAYAAFPEYKAMAVNDDGTAFLSIRQCSAAKAADDALDSCRHASGGQACRPAAVGNADASGLEDSAVAQLIRQHSRA